MNPSRFPRRSPAGLPLLITLDADSAEPLFRQLYRSMRDAILDGRLAPGLRLPSTRVLAADLTVSRNTVVAAFEQLHAEGYLDSHVGRGTQIAEALPEYFRQTARPLPSQAEPSKPSVATRPSRRATEISRAAAARSLLTDPVPLFRPGLPALDQFPLRIWQRLVTRCARALSERSLAYSDSFGFTPLRRAIAEYLSASRGMTCRAEQIFIVSGTQQALHLSAHVALDPGDVAWVEDPGYHGAVGALTAAGASIVGARVDADGIDVDAVRDRAPHARLAYVTPSHQFPTGATMSLARRLTLLEWARTAGAWVVEDDYDSEYRYVSRPLTALHGLDGGQRVIYCGTFSKVLFPALRIGFVVVPVALVDAFGAARDVFDIHRATLEQMVLAEFMNEGHFERHLRRMRTLYHERRDVLVAAIRSEFGDGASVGGADAGMHLVLWLPSDVDAADVQRRAAALAIDAIPVSAFAVDRTVAPGLVLGYSHLDPGQIRVACRQLADAVARASRLVR
jgi:GntR family transcriptional regulator / MocR family aminotransferase